MKEQKPIKPLEYVELGRPTPKPSNNLNPTTRPSNS